jgi:2-polyprenyl-6-methoxyphenol hydroxylase-like FAD-dependent oxidoreductase
MTATADDAQTDISSAQLRRINVDVAIVGAGMGGAASAAVLGRAGYKVALIDRHATYPAEFRAEKITGGQVDLLKRLGLFEAVTKIATPYDDIVAARGGHVVDRKRIPEYGVPYQAMVAAVRGEVPSSVDVVTGVVTALEAADDSQEVRLSDGRVVTARLIILASGLNGNLVEDLGIGHRFVHKGHTLCIGFTVAPVAKAAFDFQALTYYGAGVADKIDYISFFPMAGGMRANLFAFHGLHDEWSLKMRDAPYETLIETLPGLKKFTGDFAIVDKAKLRAIDLRFADNYRKAGVVLIGDAFQTSCPAAGTGITRALSDVDRLCQVYVPQWLASPGMGAEKIGTFYDDPVKKACDAHAQHVAHYRRAITIDRSMPWELRRRLIFPLRRASELMRRTARNASWLIAMVRSGFMPAARS